jgi:hypothetical protein
MWVQVVRMDAIYWLRLLVERWLQIFYVHNEGLPQLAHTLYAEKVEIVEL